MSCARASRSRRRVCADGHGSTSRRRESSHKEGDRRGGSRFIRAQGRRLHAHAFHTGFLTAAMVSTPPPFCARARHPRRVPMSPQAPRKSRAAEGRGACTPVPPSAEGGAAKASRARARVPRDKRAGFAPDLKLVLEELRQLVQDVSLHRDFLAARRGLGHGRAACKPLAQRFGCLLEVDTCRAAGT